MEVTPVDCPDTHSWTGKYENHSYGFSIIMPKGFEGFWNSARCVSVSGECACMSDHGRFIPLRNEPSQAGRQIEAYAGFATDEPTVAAEVKNRLDWIKDRSRGNRVIVMKRSKVKLGSLIGERVLFRYFDRKLKVLMIEDFTEAVKGSVSYTIYLRTRLNDYQHDQATLETVLASFTLTTGEYQNEK